MMLCDFPFGLLFVLMVTSDNCDHDLSNAIRPHISSAELLAYSANFILAFSSPYDPVP